MSGLQRVPISCDSPVGEKSQNMNPISKKLLLAYPSIEKTRWISPHVSY